MELNLLYTFIILSSLGFLYRRFMAKIDYMSMKKDNRFLKEFIETNYSGDFKNNKPIAWIYLPFEKNAMKWQSFYSRNTLDINNTLLKELIYKNTTILSTHFNVLIVDDTSFKYLLDENITDLETVGQPLKDKIVDLYMLKLIKNYGGLRVPNHFAIQDPDELFNLIQQTTRENILCFKRPFNNTFIYDIQFVGSLFNNNTTVEHIINLQSSLISGDSVDESNFITSSIPHLVSKNILDYDITKTGVFDINNEILAVEDFMSHSKPIQLYPNVFMVYLPIEYITKRTNYNWITYEASSYPIQINKYLQ
jgi:hypothetical protein